eukprot:TRINITY_DN7273_c0_g2_i1.p1 TRINITY_DN7273_c0_g2~~TRINITY_DN7273_c0_g2_i1.p1  ORF type:complete len:187 (+),score=34.12 TRINITY_DN7273_c0_g2_i1:42-563(+)
MDDWIKLMVLGNDGVGKSSLVIRISNKCFVNDYDPTIADAYNWYGPIDDKNCSVQIWDHVAGEAQGKALLKTTHAFVLVYTITSRISFNRLIHYRNEILRAKGAETVPMILVGSRADMEESRTVTHDLGQLLAKDFGCPFFETSALTGANVHECFCECIREFRRSQGPVVHSK